MPAVTWDQRADDLAAAMAVQQSEIWQHKKSGGLYVVVERSAYIEADLTPAVVYRSLFDGAVWVRPAAEFFDGRFRNLSVDEVTDCRPENERGSP
ncbi:MAG: DUF1653 domain-containing protein [Pseudomonadota bacterium]